MTHYTKVSETIAVAHLDNGLAVVAEQMPWLESVAIALHIAAGCAYDPPEALGLANLVAEMVQRGCGTLSSREFLETLERLGADHGGSVGVAHAVYRAALIADNLPAVLPIYADLVRRPRLPVEQFEDARQVCLQELRALADDFPQQCMIRLQANHYGDPWGRDELGTWESVQSMTYDDVVSFYQQNYGPREMILSVAGKFDWDWLLGEVERLFGDWSGQPGQMASRRPGTKGYEHLTRDTQQTHIALACPSVPYSNPDYFQARAAVGVLSDGASSRLFTEVREKRGLCYTVTASCQSTRDEGAIFCYAGTTTERAQETLDVLVDELLRLGQGVTADEWARVQAKIKSALIMQQESSSARSAALAADYYHWGKPLPLDELRAILDGITCNSINEYLARNPPRVDTVVSLGARALELPCGIPQTHAG